MKKLTGALFLLLGNTMAFSQVYFDGNLKNTLSPATENIIDVLPDKSYFDKAGKFDSLQNQIWSFNFQGLVPFGVKKIKSDKDGGCIVAGDFSGNLVVGSDTLKPLKSGNAITDVVLMHFTKNGTRDWWIRFSEAWAQYPTQFYSDKVMDLECTRDFAYLTFHAPNKGPTYYVGPDYSSDSFQVSNFICILKIDMKTGKVAWKKIPSGKAYGINQLDLSVNKSGDVAFNYSSIDNLDWGNGVQTNRDGTWVVKIAADGTTKWATCVNSNPNLIDDSEAEIADNGEVFFSAKTPNAYPNTILNIPINSNFIGKLTETGSIAWVRKFSDLTAYYINIAYHKGHIYFRGDIGKTAKFIQSDANDSISIVATGNNNSCIYFGRFDANGKLDWHLIGTGGSGSANGIAGILQQIDDGSGVFCVGAFQTGSTFGNYSVPSNGISYWTKFITLKTDQSSASVESDYWHSGVKIYPNPASEHLQIELPDAKQAIIKIYDLNGRLVFEKQLLSSFDTMNLPLEPGSYVTVIQQGEYMKTMKLVVQK